VPAKPRPIDHLVLAVRDLDAARATYAKLGFTVAPIAHHPFGTSNSVVQMNGGYLELLAVTDQAKIPPATETGFSFAGFNRDYLEHREGFSAIALQSEDAAADIADFAAHKLPTYDLVKFERMAKGPDGSERPLAFSLAFTSDARTHGQAAFFTCQHHHSENFWRPEYQRHANGALRVDSAVFVTRDPADFHIFFTWFTGQHDILSTSLHTSFDLGPNRLDVLSPVAFRAFFGEEAGPDPRRFTGYRITVADLVATRAHLKTNAVPFAELHEAVVVPSTFAHGCAIAFVTAGL
jgi:catechol 2,3-dioxygenase-like lactoylglutathione lyase family enzyme